MLSSNNIPCRCVTYPFLKAAILVEGPINNPFWVSVYRQNKNWPGLSDWPTEPPVGFYMTQEKYKNKI